MSPSTSPAVPTCDLIPAADVANVVGVSASVVPESSNAFGCTYQVESGGPGSYQITIRAEDSFPDLASIRGVFSGGDDVSGLGAEAYWADAVTTLWFEQNGGLYAVQLVGFDAAGADSLALEVAHLAASKL